MEQLNSSACWVRLVNDWDCCLHNIHFILIQHLPSCWLCACCLQIGVLITFLLLLIFSSSVVFLFVGTASLGLFLSSTFPSMLAYTEDILQYKGEWGSGHTWHNLKAGRCSSLELRYNDTQQVPPPALGMLRRIRRKVWFWISSSFELVVGKADCTNPRFAALITSTGRDPDCCLVSCSFRALRQECQCWKHHPGYQRTENPLASSYRRSLPTSVIQKNENLFSKKQQHFCWWGQVTEQMFFVFMFSFSYSHESVSPLDGNFHWAFLCNLKWLQAGPAGCHYHHLCCFFSGCATTVLVTGAGIGEMVLQLLVGSVSVGKGRRWGVPKPAWTSLEISVQVLDSCSKSLSYQKVKLSPNAN